MADFSPNFRVLLTVFAIIALSFCLSPLKASALTLAPTRFEIRGNPGDTLDEEIMLINETGDTETYYPSYANFEAQGESGSPAFVEPKDDLGTWITMTLSSITLTPGQQKLVPFKVTIPEGAEPGGHFAVAFFGITPDAPGSGVGVGSKTGVLVLLSVNGDVKEQAGLLNFNTVGKQFFYKTLPVTFEYRFRNDGGDRIKPTGEIAIRDTIFLPADYLNANPVEGNVLPDSTRKIQVNWLKYDHPANYVAPKGIFSKFWSNVTYEARNFAVGLYSANLNIAYGAQNQHVKKTTFFFVFPWELMLVLIIVFIIVFWGGKKLIKRYNKFIIEKARAGTR